MKVTRNELESFITTWNAQREMGRHVPLLKARAWNGKMHIEQILSSEGAIRTLCTGTTTECFKWFDAFREGYWWTEYHTDEF